MPKEYCAFCDRINSGEDRTFDENDQYYVRWDLNPVAKGHSVIISKKHIESFFDLGKKELASFFDQLKKVKEITDEKFHPDGYNIGINEGEAAGRTIHHLHIHIIPRYKGDVENPRGGVRHVIPERGDYKS